MTAKQTHSGRLLRQEKATIATGGIDSEKTDVSPLQAIKAYMLHLESKRSWIEFHKLCECTTTDKGNEWTIAFFEEMLKVLK